MQTYYDSLCVKTYDSREEMGAAAAKDAAACLKKLLEEGGGELHVCGSSFPE